MPSYLSLQAGGALLLQGGGGLLTQPSDAAIASLKQALVYHLAHSAPLAALVGDRVRPDYLPESDARPAIAYEVLSDQVDVHLTGVSGTATARVKLAIVGDDPASCDAVRAAVANRLNGYRGAPGGGAVFFIRAKLSDETDSYHVRLDGSDDAYHVVEVEYLIRRNVPAPDFT